jgi:pectate lyase
VLLACASGCGTPNSNVGQSTAAGASGSAGNASGGDSGGGDVGAAPTGGTPGNGGTSGLGGDAGAPDGTPTGGSGPGETLSTDGITCAAQTWNTAPVGWATVSGGTTGGGDTPPVTVTTLAAFNQYASGSKAAVIHVSGKFSGTPKIGSNKTIWGLCGAEIDGSLDMTGSSNVIIRNLKVVGENCMDSPSDCSAGSDAIHVDGGDKHLWFDHMDISDGSDGTLDITHGSDLITISWTKFHYSGRRAGDHQFCNLIGHDDANVAQDSGHLNVTFDHVWWADNVDQRMPRVRFGKVHIFNSLYTAAGDSACIEVGVSANIRSENNLFQGVKNAVDTSHKDAASIIQSIGNLGSSANLGGVAFTPPYPYVLDPVTSVDAMVRADAGPK